MVLDLNFPPEDGLPDAHGILHQLGAAAGGHEAPSLDLDLNKVPSESANENDVAGGFFDVNLGHEEVYESDVETLNAAAEVACFDLNSNLYDSESDDDGNVYAEDFHVILGEGNLQGSSAPAHGQQGSQHENTNVVRRQNLTEEQIKEIYEELLLISNKGKLDRRATTRVATLFNVKRSYVQAIWRKAKKCRRAGVPVNVYSQRKLHCGRPRVIVDLSRIKTMPLEKRTTLKSIAEELGVKKTTLHRLFKEGKIRRHSNTLKPCLRDDNKKQRLQYCLSMVDGETVHNEPKFIDMKNIIHIDEKWFNTTKKVKKFYLLPEEEDPLITVQNKNSIPKCMLLCGVSSPMYDSEGTCYFDGKIGIWPFVRKEPAQRASRNRPRGTLITKSINVTREVSRSYLISKVLPAIVACWPQEHRGETIWIQQDNARTHIEPNDEVFHEAVRQIGLDIRIFNQPPNSPDLNVLDLGFFASLQTKTFLTSSRNMDELIQNVQNEFNDYDESLLRRVFLTLQGCMIEIMTHEGGNGYKIPHMNKDGLEAAGALPTSLNVVQELYQCVIQKLSE